MAKEKSDLEKILAAGWKIKSRHTRGYLTLVNDRMEMIYNRKEDRIVEVYKTR